MYRRKIFCTLVPVRYMKCTMTGCQRTSVHFTQQCSVRWKCTGVYIEMCTKKLGTNSSTSFTRLIVVYGSDFTTIYTQSHVAYPFSLGTIYVSHIDSI